MIINMKIKSIVASISDGGACPSLSREDAKLARLAAIETIADERWLPVVLAQIDEATE